MKFSTKSVLLLSNLVLSAVSAQHKKTKITNLSEVQKKIEEMKINRNLQKKDIKQKRRLEEDGFNIFSFNEYVESIKDVAGISDTCMAAFREINFFQTEYDLHDPLNQVGDSLVAFEEAPFQEYPVPIGQIAVGDSAAKKQCKDNGGQHATLNGSFYADSGITESLLQLGVQGIIGRPGLLGNYLAVIALALFSALAPVPYVISGPNVMSGPYVMSEGPVVSGPFGPGSIGNPTAMMGFFLFTIISNGLNSIEGCVETYNYIDRFVCLPKDESACTDEEIVRMHAVSDSTYYLIHGFDTILQTITSLGLFGPGVGGPVAGPCYGEYGAGPCVAGPVDLTDELILRTDLFDPLPSADGEGECSQSVTISKGAKAAKATKSPFLRKKV